MSVPAPESPPASSIEFVTVAFSGDLPLLDLQARSLAAFASPKLVAGVRIVINDPDDAACRQHIAAQTAPLLGPLRDRLRVETAPMSGEPGQQGWMVQQACKLDVARRIEAPHYVVLDAKNFLLRPITAKDLFFRGSLARMPFSRQRGDPAWLADSLAFFDLDPALGEGRWPASVPPFPMRTEVVVRMIAEIERRAGCDLFRFFATKTDASTEFMLYIAYLLHAGELEAVVSRRGTKQPIMRRASPKRGEPGPFFEKAATDNAWTMAIHRRRFLDLDWDHPTREGIVDVWSGSGLFPNRAAAEAEMARLIAFYQDQRGTAMMANRSKVLARPAVDEPAAG